MDICVCLYVCDYFLYYYKIGIFFFFLISSYLISCCTDNLRGINSGTDHVKLGTFGFYVLDLLGLCSLPFPQTFVLTYFQVNLPLLLGSFMVRGSKKWTELLALEAR